MILFIEEMRTARLSPPEIDELEALALEHLREIHRLKKYTASPAIDRKIEREQGRLVLVESVLYRRGGLVLLAHGHSRYEFVPEPTKAEEAEIDRLEELAEGPAPMVNWVGLGVHE
jgi:hypothetical protein